MSIPPHLTSIHQLPFSSLSSSTVLRPKQSWGKMESPTPFSDTAGSRFKYKSDMDQQCDKTARKTQSVLDCVITYYILNKEDANCSYRRRPDCSLYMRWGALLLRGIWLVCSHSKGLNEGWSVKVMESHISFQHKEEFYNKMLWFISVWG